MPLQPMPLQPMPLQPTLLRRSTASSTRRYQPLLNAPRREIHTFPASADAPRVIKELPFTLSAADGILSLRVTVALSIRYTIGERSPFSRDLRGLANDAGLDACGCFGVDHH